MEQHWKYIKLMKSDKKKAECNLCSVFVYSHWEKLNIVFGWILKITIRNISTSLYTHTKLPIMRAAAELDAEMQAHLHSEIHQQRHNNFIVFTHTQWLQQTLAAYRPTQPCIPPGLLNRVPALTGWGKDGNFTSARWQVTLCVCLYSAHDCGQSRLVDKLYRPGSRQVANVDLRSGRRKNY